MSQFAFGSGNMYITQLQDASGNLIANPTPMPLMVLQEGSVEFSRTNKELYGGNSFPVDIAQAEQKCVVKVKPARIFANVWNSLYFGQALTSGLLANYTDVTGIAIPSTPFSVTVVPPATGSFAADLGVLNALGQPMKRVASAPATSQYSVNVSTGAYTFAAADVGLTVYINYQYSATVTGAQTLAIKSLPMGSAACFKADLTVIYQGKLTTMSFNRCTSNKFSIGFKNSDFAIPEFDFSLMDDGLGGVAKISTSE